MHLHASASEGVGSVRAQLGQAATQRLRRRLVHRPRLAPAPAAVPADLLVHRRRDAVRRHLERAEDGRHVGSLATGSGGALVTSPVEPERPGDPEGLAAHAGHQHRHRAATARNRVAAEGSSRANFRGRIAGRTIVFDVLPSRSGVNAWGEVLLRLSFHPGAGTRPAGVLTLTYRLRTDVTTRTRSASGLSGFVDVPVTAGAWQTVTLDPRADAARDLDRRPAPTTTRSTRSSSTPCPGASRSPSTSSATCASSSRPATTPSASSAHCWRTTRASFPASSALNGTEISLAPHMNQYGGPQTPFDYGPLTSLRTIKATCAPTSPTHVHGLGGLVSINHPFKPGDGDSNITPQGRRARPARHRARRRGPDRGRLREQGHQRPLAAHLAAWDTRSPQRPVRHRQRRLRRPLRARTGAADQPLLTGAWTSSCRRPTLLDAFRAPAARTSDTARLVLRRDRHGPGRHAPMGSALVGERHRSRTLQFDVTGLPAGGAVQVLRGTSTTRDRAPGRTPPCWPPHSAHRPDRLGHVRSHRGPTASCGPGGHSVSGAVVGFGQPIWAAPRSSRPPACPPAACVDR